ncbi:hypothetical protein [Burkholderia cepacia]|uniref:hypothetical protein n=1 Tax=Burkholderia cepacia TaxID=292 RepID=UPI000A8EE64C|nr:hypothetical protein [Burkholderia cepacia]
MHIGNIHIPGTCSARNNDNHTHRADIRKFANDLRDVKAALNNPCRRDQANKQLDGLKKKFAQLSVGVQQSHSNAKKEKVYSLGIELINVITKEKNVTQYNSSTERRQREADSRHKARQANPNTRVATRDYEETAQRPVKATGLFSVPTSHRQDVGNS